MPDLLEFEEPIGVLQREIEALRMLPRTTERQAEIQRLDKRVDEVRREIYGNLTPWQHVLIARHADRPHTLDYVGRVFEDFTEIHGDRRFGDDPAIVAGFARFGETPVMVVGHQKGRGTKEKIRRNFGYARPEGYRKALRAMKLAEKFDRPVVVFVDTPAAYPGIDSEERGVAEAIAVNLREMAMLSVPVIVVVTGEGGSGGALGIAIGDRVLIQQYAIYSVIPPEGCAAILWRDAARKADAADALKIRPDDLVALHVVDDVIPEPIGGAHADAAAAAALLAPALRKALDEVAALAPDARRDLRYEKFRQMGDIGIHEAPETSPVQSTP